MKLRVLARSPQESVAVPGPCRSSARGTAESRRAIPCVETFGGTYWLLNPPNRGAAVAATRPMMQPIACYLWRTASHRQHAAVTGSPASLVLARVTGRGTVGRTAMSVKRVLIVCAIFATTSCSPCHFYDGDGECGRIGAGYAVRFAFIRLDKPGTYTFRFTGLAPRNFIVGFRLTSPSGTPLGIDEHGRSAVMTQDRPNPLIEITLVNERSETVISESKRLRDWTWWSDFVNIRGVGQDVPLPSGGGTRFVRQAEKPDRGWGTSFQPRSAGRYTLIIKIVEPDPVATAVVINPTIETYLGSL